MQPYFVLLRLRQPVWKRFWFQALVRCIGKLESFSPKQLAKILIPATVCNCMNLFSLKTEVCVTLNQIFMGTKFPD